jgi:hypothetical protein
VHATPCECFAYGTKHAVKAYSCSGLEAPCILNAKIRRRRLELGLPYSVGGQSPVSTPEATRGVAGGQCAQK